MNARLFCMLSVALMFSACAGVEYVHRDLGGGKAFVMTTISDPNAFTLSIHRNYAEVCNVSKRGWFRSPTYTNCQEAGAEYIVSETGWFAGLFKTAAISGVIVSSTAFIGQGLK